MWGPRCYDKCNPYSSELWRYRNDNEGGDGLVERPRFATCFLRHGCLCSIHIWPRRLLDSVTFDIFINSSDFRAYQAGPLPHS